MKKWFLILILALVIILFIPFSFKQPDTIQVPFPLEAVMRTINDPHQKNWLPGEYQTDSSFKYNGRSFIGYPSSATGYYIVSTDQAKTVRMRIDVLPAGADSSKIIFHSSFRTSSNPLKKIPQLIEAWIWRGDHRQFKEALQQFFQSTEHVYGYPIRMDKVKHSPHVSRLESYPVWPGIDTAYQLIGELRQYVASQNARIVDSPIMNVVMDGGRYKLMVAVPTDRKLSTSGKVLLKEMVLGNILIADVTGGPSSINRCREQLENYARDFNKLSPAIPFERLITNRITEKDSSRWVSTVNYPVFR